MVYSGDTIAALATPNGTSAIAIVRASGPGAADLVRTIFNETPLPRSARHADYRDRNAQLIDDVLFTFFASPNSFTGEDTLEISCHGNPFIAQKILEDLLSRGCRSAEAGEFSKRAFLNGRLDLSQAEAVMDLIHARSERALAAANQQLRGSLGRHMEDLISRLVKILAEIEAYIDFPDEDLPEQNREDILREINELIVRTNQLIATNHYGDLLREGIKVLILGETNAGKSSLLNRLVGQERALVSPDPGTTRDYIEERVMLGSHWARLIDTAGLNDAPTPLEKRGIIKTLEQSANADIFLWVIDATQPPPLLPDNLHRRMNATNTLGVLNKCDLPGSDRDPAPTSFPIVRISALRGDGFDVLRTALIKLVDSLVPSLGDEVIAINSRHAHALEEARACLSSARDKISEVIHNELVASDLRMATASFGEIAGKIDNEKVLDEIFARFCIGK